MTATLLLALAATPPASPPPVVTVAEPAEVTIVAGASAEARLEVTIAPGYKIQANPASQRFLVPARLELEANERVRAAAPEYPPGRPYRLEGAASDIAVYEGTFLIRVPLDVAGSAVDGLGSRVVLAGQLHYQACNRQRCLRPSSVPVRVPVRIAPVR